MQGALDDFYADVINGERMAILNDNSLDDCEKIIALLELPDPTMDEEKAEKLLEQHKERQKRRQITAK
jgi:hypothetical protein